MSAALFDSVTRIARHEAAARSIAAIGVVADVFDGGGFPADHAVSVQLRETGLLLPRVPVAVGALGFAATPEPGDLVVVVFADGDVHAGVVVGRLYHADLDPPDHGPGDIVLRLPAGASTPSFEAVLRGGDPSLRIQAGPDVSVLVDDTTVRMTAGNAEATVQAGGGGRAEVTVGTASVTITGRGDIELATTGKIVLRATDIELAGRASVTVSAPEVKVN